MTASKFEPYAIEKAFTNQNIIVCALINIFFFVILSYLQTFLMALKDKKKPSKAIRETNTHAHAIFGALIPFGLHVIFSFVAVRRLEKLLLFPVLGFYRSIYILLGFGKIEEKTLETKPPSSPTSSPPKESTSNK